MRVAALAHHMQRARALARTGARPEIWLEAVEHSLELRRRTRKKHRCHHNQLVGILKQRIHVVHIVTHNATMRRLVFNALRLKRLIVSQLFLAQLAFRLPFAPIARSAASNIKRGNRRQKHLVFRAFLDAGFKQQVRKRTAAALNTGRSNDDQAFHSQFLSYAAACAALSCQDVGGRSSNVRAFALS